MIAEVITMKQVLEKNLSKIICEHCKLDFTGDIEGYFKRFGIQLEVIYSKLENDFNYLSENTKEIIRKIYRQYECVVKGEK